MANSGFKRMRVVLGPLTGYKQDVSESGVEVDAEGVGWLTFKFTGPPKRMNPLEALWYWLKAEWGRRWA